METPIIVEIFPALKGDSFLVSYGSKHILVDCGYSSTYHSFIKPALIEIHKRNECIERLIITHIDSDHIAGAIELLSENIIAIEQIWHNTYRHLQFDNIQNISLTSRGDLVLNGVLARGLKREKDVDLMKEISALQGSSLGSLILKGKYGWNTDFQNKAVSIENNSFIKLDNKIGFKLLSPNRTKLEKLARLWIEELKKLGIRNKLDNSQALDDAFEFLASFEKSKPYSIKREISAFTPTIEELLKVSFQEDQKITNGSSIAFVLMINSKELLFLGDSHPGIIEESLKQAYAAVNHPVQFDMIKVSHHGAFNNTSPSLLSMIDSPFFLFSTNGGNHSHPDKETIAHIVTRNAKMKRTLVFNYRTKNSEYFNDKELMKKYNYAVKYADVNMPIKIIL